MSIASSTWSSRVRSLKSKKCSGVPPGPQFNIPAWMVCLTSWADFGVPAGDAGPWPAAGRFRPGTATTCCWRTAASGRRQTKSSVRQARDTVRDEGGHNHPTDTAICCCSISSVVGVGASATHVRQSVHALSLSLRDCHPATQRIVGVIMFQ